MRMFKKLAASAAALLLCFSATEAFAGLSMTGTGTSGSWFMDFTVNQAGGIGNVTGGFTKMVATVVPGAVNYTVSSNTGIITNPSLFEDNKAGGGGHDVWNDATSGTNNFAASGWAQTIPVAGATGNVLTSTATGALVLGGGLSSLSFRLNFTGNENLVANADGTNGAHFFIDFFNAGNQLVSRYEIKNVINSASIQVTEITQVPVPLPSAAWAGIAMLGGMGVFFAKRRRSRANLA